jgi:hypothetical protein
MQNSKILSECKFVCYFLIFGVWFANFYRFVNENDARR